MVSHWRTRLPSVPPRDLPVKRQPRLR
jgi:hypothetical protein